MRRRILAMLGTLVFVISLTLAAATAGPAHATNGPQLCSTAAGTLCMNSNHGDHSVSSAVISWYAGDNNNTYEPIQLTGICGDGYVDGYNNGACPFRNGSGLNDQYNGDAIVEFEDYDTVNMVPPLCVGTTTSGSTYEVGCSPNGSWGGGTGSVYVLYNVQNFSQLGANPWYAVNFHYTDGYCGLGRSAYLVSASAGAPNYANICTANNQWYEVP